MKAMFRAGTAALFLILAPAATYAQFETLRFTEVPAVGSWAEYRLTSDTGGSKRIMPQVVSLVSRSQVGDQEYLWFQVETEIDGLGPKRQSLVYQFAVPVAAVEQPSDMFTKIHEMIVQIADRPAFRVARDFLNVGISKNLLVGGSGGAGTEVDYQYRDLDAEKVETPAGVIECTHKKGIGEGEVVLSYDDPKRFGVDSIVDMWYSDQVPFGLVKRTVRTTGKEEAKIPGGDVTLDNEETTELVAWGTGAKSAIQGQVFDYSPAIAEQLRPVN